MLSRRAPIPVAYFGIAVGSLAFANAWRVAARLWSLPAAIPALLTGVALVVWLGLLVLYAHKWLRRRDEALAELAHPVQSSFVALVPVSSLLASLALLPLAPVLAWLVFGASMAAQLALGLWLYGRFWQGGRPVEQVTPAIYMPVVAQNFVAATAAAAFGWPQVGSWFFGAGLLSWLAIESLILGRAAGPAPLPAAQRPLLGIQLAPAVVGGVAWLGLNGGRPDLFAQILLGYGLYQALLMARLLPWVREQPFAPSYWAFSFGTAAMPTLAMRMLEGGAGGALTIAAPAIFIAANLVIGLLAWKTVSLLANGRLLPPAAAAPSPR